MRSIGRVEAPRWLSDEFLKGRGSTHVRTNRDILGESDARHCQRPGTWQKRVHHDLCPFARGRGGSLRLPSRVCPHGTPTVLGINLNCSELRGRPGPQALLMADSGSPPGIMCLIRAPSGYATATLAPSKGRLMRCTVDGLTPNRSAMTRMPGRQELPEPHGLFLQRRGYRRPT